MKTHTIYIQFHSYGHWKISTEHYGKKISCITTNSRAVDDYEDDDEHISARGLKSLRSEIIESNKKLVI